MGIDVHPHGLRPEAQKIPDAAADIDHLAAQAVADSRIKDKAPIQRSERASLHQVLAIRLFSGHPAAPGARPDTQCPDTRTVRWLPLRTIRSTHLSTQAGSMSLRPCARGRQTAPVADTPGRSNGARNGERCSNPA